MFVDEGVYLFFDNEMAAQGEFAADLAVDLSIVLDFESGYTNLGVHSHAELKPLSERKFIEFCGKAKSVLYTYVRSLIDLELDLDDAEIVDRFREIICNEGLLFVAEIGDANFFWTGASVKRWFKARLPLKPKEMTYAKPPTVIDLLYEFLESVSHSRDNLLTLKETLLVLSDDDRSFVEDILSGKNPKNSAKARDASARILHALKDRML